MPRKLGDITQPDVISRFLNLAVAVAMRISLVIHLEGEKLLEGTLFAKIVDGGPEDGKFRAYAEADAEVAFSAASPNFDLEDQADGFLKMKQFRVGDTIEGVDGTALGEIATYDPLTGVGTLTVDSANAYGIGLAVRVVAAELSLANGDGRILKSESLMEDLDRAESAYVEGFFNESRVIGATTASKLVLETKSYVDGEIRLR